MRFVKLEDSVGHVYVNPALVRWVAGNGLGQTIVAFGLGDGSDGAAGTLIVDGEVDSVAGQLEGAGRITRVPLPA